MRSLRRDNRSQARVFLPGSSLSYFQRDIFVCEKWGGSLLLRGDNRSQARVFLPGSSLSHFSEEVLDVKMGGGLLLKLSTTIQLIY